MANLMEKAREQIDSLLSKACAKAGETGCQNIWGDMVCAIWFVQFARRGGNGRTKNSCRAQQFV